MSELMTLDIPDTVADAIAQAAKASGVSPETFVLEAAATRAAGLIDAQAFFAERAKQGSVDALVAVLARTGGQPPAPGDEAA